MANNRTEVTIILLLIPVVLVPNIRLHHVSDTAAHFDVLFVHLHHTFSSVRTDRTTYKENMATDSAEHYIQQ